MEEFTIREGGREKKHDLCENTFIENFICVSELLARREMAVKGYMEKTRAMVVSEPPRLVTAINGKGEGTRLFAAYQRDIKYKKVNINFINK